MSKVYKGRASLMELANMPASMFQVLYMIAFEDQESKEAQEQAKADAVEEVMEEGGLIP